ncbi:MAG TPA: hypothetical protein VMT12_07505 [Syntrophales bacterium]|nr:hypothetical protein [Syntrophales bacterium]
MINGHAQAVAYNRFLQGESVCCNVEEFVRRYDIDAICQNRHPVRRFRNGKRRLIF